MLRKTHAFHVALPVLAFAILAFTAVSVPADEPQSAEVTSAGSAAAATAQTAAPAPPPRPLTPEEAALQAITAEGQALVADYLAQGEADPSRMEQVQREITRVKTETRVRYLRALVDFARQRGDERALQEAQAALEATLRPPVPAVVPNDREQTDLKAREVRR